MILRRLAANFRRQDWMAIGIELMIVVFGVFIGLQTQEWATAHAEQQRADVLFQQLRGDLDAEKINLQAIREYLEVVADNARITIRGLQAPDSVDPGTWVASAYQATQLLQPQSARATFDEMKSTGAIDLIRNARLRTMLIGYYDGHWSDAPLLHVEVPYRELLRSRMPYPVQEAVKAACGDYLDSVGIFFVPRIPKTCHLNMPPAELARAAAKLRVTPGLLPAATYQLSVTEAKIQIIGQQQQQLDAVIAAAAKATR